MFPHDNDEAATCAEISPMLDRLLRKYAGDINAVRDILDRLLQTRAAAVNAELEQSKGSGARVEDGVLKEAALLKDLERVASSKNVTPTIEATVSRRINSNRIEFFL